MHLDIRLALVLLMVPAPRLGAQWFVGADVATTWFGGTSHDTAAGSDNQSFRPYRPTAVGLRLERRFVKVGVGLHLSYAEPALADEGDQAVIAIKDFTTVYGAAVDASFRFAQTSTGVTFRVHAGPFVDVWTLTGEDELRPRWGMHGAVSTEFPFGGRLSGSVRLSGALSPSVFKPGELPPDFVRRTMRRGAISLGLRYRL